MREKSIRSRVTPLARFSIFTPKAVGFSSHSMNTIELQTTAEQTCRPRLPYAQMPRPGWEPKAFREDRNERDTKLAAEDLDHARPALTIRAGQK
jgi:hypothetical protein